jgi:hypothetical protein
MLLSGISFEGMTGRKYPICLTRRDNNSMTPSATKDFPLPGSIPAMYKLCAIGFSFSLTVR